MFELKTKRLRIIPLTFEQLKLYKNNQNEFERNMGLTETEPPKFDETIENEVSGAWIFWINSVKKNPFTYTWFTRWEIILTEENRIVGSCCFKGAPNKNGEVEIGYMIDPSYQNKGFMTEALSEFIRYAFLNYKVKSAIAETPPDNYPSHKVLIKNGFKQIGNKDGNLVWRLENNSE
jgi:RimJ/RimL family protein N-acetyltransferase